jgi:hypothetical protein
MIVNDLNPKAPKADQPTPGLDTVALTPAGEVPEVNYVDIASTLPNLDKLPSAMQEYVLENFSSFSQEDIDVLNSQDDVVTAEVLKERVGLDAARLQILEEFGGEPTQDFVNQDPQVLEAKVKSRLSELYPGVESEPDFQELSDTVSEVIRQEEFRGNPASILYRDGGILGETTFSELESFKTLGDSLLEANRSRDTINPFDLELGNPFPSIEEATGVSVAASSLDILKFGTKSALDALAFLTESPAFAVDLAESFLIMTPEEAKRIEDNMWDPAIFVSPDEDPFFGPMRIFLDDSLKDYRNNIRNTFRGNRFATYLKGLIEAPTDFDGDIFGRVRQGDVAGAGKQAAYMLSGLIGELGGTLGAGVGLKALKIGAPRLSVALGGLAAERRQQELLEEGVPRERATVNSAIYGTVNAVLSEYVVVEKLRHMTRLTSRDFGVETGREFATNALVNLAKTMAFDGAAMATSEGLLETADYLTGIKSEFDYEAALKRTGNGFILGALTGGVLGVPSRYAAFRNRNVRAQSHVDQTMALADLYNMMSDIPNPRMRDAVATLMRDNAQMPTQVFVNPKDLGPSLGMTEAQLSSATGTPLEVISGAREAGLGVAIPIDVALRQMAENPKGLDFRPMKMSPDGPTAQESAAYIDAVDSFYRGVLRRTVKVGTLVDELAARVRLKDVAPTRSSDSLARSVITYSKSIWNSSITRVRDQFKKRDIEVQGPQTRAPIVDFTSTLVPDVPIPGATLKTMPDSFTSDVNPAQAFPERIVTDLAQAQLIRGELNREYQQFTESYRIKTGLEGLASETLTGIESENFNAAKVQLDIYQSIMSDSTLQEAADLLLGGPNAPVSELTGQPFKINYQSFQNLYGKEAAARLSRGLRKTIFTKKKDGIPIEQALTELGFTPEVFYNLLSDSDIRGVVKAGGVEQYAISESQRLSKSVMRNLEQYNAMASSDVDPTRVAYEKWLRDGEANSVIDKHLSSTMDAVRAKELNEIETRLTKEFARQKSPLIKGGRLTNEAKADIEREILNLDYKYVQKSGFIRDALSLENFYNNKSAEMVKNGNFPQAYRYKTQSLKMREYVRAQYKAIRAIKDTQKVVDWIVKSDLTELNQQGYDTDYVLGARLVLERSGAVRASAFVQDQLDSLAQFDPYKYERLVYEFDPYVPEVREGLSAIEYMNMVASLADRVTAAKNEPIVYKVDGKPVADVRSDIFNSLLKREIELGDRKTGGRFGPTYRAEFARAIREQRAEDPTKISVNDNILAALDRTRGQLGLREDPNSLSGIARRTAQNFSLFSDFIYSLNVPELSKVADLVRESTSNLINSVNGPGGHVEFLTQLNQLVNLNSESLSFKGKKQFASEMFTAPELISIALNLGNMENAARLARRNFNTDIDGLKTYVREAIENGVLTEAHFKFAQVMGDRYEVKFKDVQREHKKTFGRYVKLSDKRFPFGDVVPKEWIKSGWYAPIKTNMSPISEKSLFQKKSAVSIEKAQEQFARSGYMESLSDLLSETPVVASYEKSRSTIEGERLSLDASSYVNHLLKIERINHIREASVVTSEVFLDKNIYTLLDSISPGVMENTIWPAVRAFNDQSIHSGALGDIRMESAYEAASKLTTAITGLTSKLQIAWNFISPVLNAFEAGKVADLIVVQDAGGVQAESGLVRPTTQRVAKALQFGMTAADLILHRNKYLYLQSLSPYLQARQQNNINYARQALDASLRQTAAMRAGLPVAKLAAQVNAYFDSVSRFADHYTQGVVETAAFSLFMDGHMRRGADFNEAIRLAERDVERVMPGYFASEVYGALRSNMARAAFMYTNWSVKRLNYATGRKREVDFQFADSMLKRWGALAPMAFIAIFLPQALEDTSRGLLSGRNDLEGLADDFLSDPLLATTRLTSQMAGSPFELIPGAGSGLKKLWLRGTNAAINSLFGEDGQHPGYLYNVYGVNKPLEFSDFVNLPAAQVVDTVAKVGTGLFTYGTEGEYQRAYEFMGRTRYTPASPGDVVSDLMAIANMSQLPIPAGPGPRNAAKFIFNLASDQDNLSDSGLLLDLLRGKGENLRGQPMTRRRKTRQRR